MTNKTTQKVSYLQMIQSSIERMSTTSAIFKGFCATIISGISATSFKEINKWVLLVALLPVICFFTLDVYYFHLEKRYRVLYNQVRDDKHDINFDLAPPKTRNLICIVISVLDCIKSPSIYLFYGPILLIAMTVIIMKFKEIV